MLLGKAEEQKKTLKQEKTLKLGDCACMRNGGNENTGERPGNKAKKKMKSLCETFSACSKET